MSGPAPSRLPLLLADSVTEAVAAEPGALLVTGSHGGASVVRYALAARPALVVFNDAGVGLDEAGIAALALLQAQGVAACAVAHSSARIGQARSSWETGVVSCANALARELGVVEGRGLREQLQRLMSA
jgi:hypothetical protein